jgi:predicted nucleotidyltransferase component of viral defense system
LLTPLQEQIVIVVGRALEDSDFALAGGAAIISQGLVDRRTRDLDFFGSSSLQLAEKIPVIIEALTEMGFQVKIDRQVERFARLEVRGLGEETEVDFGIDYRLFPTHDGEHTSVLSTKELAVDKVLAVFGRAEPRDFIDLAALSQIFEIKDLFREAVRKDQGFDLQIFAEMTKRLTVLPRREFPISDPDFEELKKIVDTWREVVKEAVLNRDRDRDRGMER